MKASPSKPIYLAVLAFAMFAGIGAYAFTKGVSSEKQAAKAATGPAAVPEADSLAPDFALERLNGETFRLSDHRGQVVAINFWATWCPPCREEIPDLIAVQEEMRDDVLFVGVSLDKGSPDKVRVFAERFGINYPVVIDDGRVLEKYGPIPGIPTTFFVGPGGRLRAKAIGLLTKENVRPVLRALAEGRKLEHLEPPFRRVAAEEVR